MQENKKKEKLAQEADAAFVSAIAKGILSQAEEDSRYAGNYMYMGNWDGIDHFKHIDTREYITCKQSKNDFFRRLKICLSVWIKRL